MDALKKYNEIMYNIGMLESLLDAEGDSMEDHEYNEVAQQLGALLSLASQIKKEYSA
jgi:hypothetical protein